MDLPGRSGRATQRRSRPPLPETVPWPHLRGLKTDQMALFRVHHGMHPGVYQPGHDGRRHLGMAGPAHHGSAREACLAWGRPPRDSQIRPVQPDPDHRIGRRGLPTGPRPRDLAVLTDLSSFDGSRGGVHGFLRPYSTLC